MEENNTPKVICAACKKEKLITSFSINGRNGYRRKICKSCIGLGITKVPIDAGEIRYCQACERQKPIKDFYRNRAMRDGYELRCKVCHFNGVKRNKTESKYPNRKPHEQKWKNYFNIVGVTKNDYRNMFLFLESSGYSLKDDIHIQFCKKWGLTPHIPKQIFKNQYTPKDFNLSS
jgi:hypothetical protein